MGRYPPVLETQAFSKNCLPASLFKKLLARKPFKKRLERKPLLTQKHYDSVITSLFKKGLSENPKKRLSLSTLSPNPIGVINRRNGFDQTAQRLIESLVITRCRKRIKEKKRITIPALAFPRNLQEMPGNPIASE